ncbi:Diaminopimelate epimerase [bioreactor metagenome]|uniref:Diaminopimelate epimerase n=1 Tax=bioreactor metagenome TaxID=1076179 RepID=A0A645CQK7_9ZZZZ
MACGSGACAAVVAGVITGRSKSKALVKLKGGILEVSWNKTANQVYLTGDAHFVFKGEVS